MDLESKRVGNLSDWYLNQQLDFDKKLIGFRYKTIQPKFVGEHALEMGSAEGEMTQFIKNDFKSLTIIEGAKELLDKIPNEANICKVHSLFEDYQPEKKFDTIIMEHILEHVESPDVLLKKVKTWLAPNGRLFIGVPNGNSIHRLVAVKMGLLTNSCELNERDHAVGHRRVYTSNTLREVITNCGLNIVEMGGVFFKPLSNQQIQDNWSEDMKQGFYQLGKDFPEHAAELFAVCDNNL